MDIENSTKLLIEQAKAGDAIAFNTLMEKNQERLGVRIAHQVQNLPSEALEVDEILQETVVQAYASLGRFEWQGKDSFYFWLSGIAKNVILKWIKKARANQDLEYPEKLPNGGTSPSRVLRRKERFHRLEEVFSKLRPEYREVLTWSRLKGLRVKEIAKKMDRTEYAIRHLLARAVLELKDLFGETESLHLPDQPLPWEGEDHGDE